MHLRSSSASEVSSNTKMTSSLTPPDGFTVNTTTTTEEAISTTRPLFPTTSQYHPNHDGLTKRRRWLVVDFDGTCTDQDTTPLLPYLSAYAAARQRKLGISSFSSKITGVDDISVNEQNKQDVQRRLVLFQSLEKEFVKRYNAVMKSSLQLRPPSCITNDDDDDDDGPSQVGDGLQVDQRQPKQSIHDILQLLDEPSTIVTGMVSKSKVLDGLGDLTVKEIEQMIQLYDGLNLLSNKAEQLLGENINSETHKVTIRLREGCLDTLTRILATTTATNNHNSMNSNNKYDSPPLTCLGWSLAVLSINWCPALIDTALVQPVIMKTRQHESLQTSTIEDESSCSKIEIPIWSNEVNGKGVISLNIPGSAAKRDCIIELRRQLLQQTTDDDNDCSPNIVIYIGDSPTDITALVEADVGIIIGNSNSMKNIISLYSHIELVPIQQLTHNFGGISILGRNRSPNKDILWQAESWKQIDDALIRLDESY